MRALTALLVTLITSCAADEPEPLTFGEHLGTPENPIPFDDEDYRVTSRIDFTASGELPAPIAAAVTTLQAFAASPAKTLLASASTAAVQQLRAQLSSTLNNQLESWIDAEIDKRRLAARTLRQFATDLAAITRTTVTQIYVPSTLIMTPARTTHMLAGLNFRPLSVDIVVPVGGLTGDALKQYPPLTVAEAGALDLGAHQFGLAFGAHAWTGINLASSTLYGDAVEPAFVDGIQCASLATAVAARCSSGACVGHASELRAICEGGAAAIVAAVRDPVRNLKLDLFRFAAGSARLVDDNGDGIAERIADGTWQAELDFGSGVRAATATFTADLGVGRSTGPR
jgi:hypothetical protein